MRRLPRSPRATRSSTRSPISRATGRSRKRRRSTRDLWRRGPLAGVPFAVKNLYDIEGLVTRAGSKINRDNPPAMADAFVVEKLEAAGAVLLGALDMDEYAYGFTGENVHDGNSLNPHDPRHMTGGSSGGSAAAVASGMAAFALGLRHQWLGARPGLALRPFRFEADLWRAVAARRFSLRRQP